MLDLAFWGTLLLRAVMATLLVLAASIPAGLIFSSLIITLRKEHFASTIGAYIGDSIIFSAYGILAGYISNFLTYHSFPSFQELVNSESYMAEFVMVWIIVGISGTFYRTRYLGE